MATNTAGPPASGSEPTAENATESPEGGKSPFGKKKLRVLILLFLIMGAEASALYLWFPQPATPNSETSGESLGGKSFDLDDLNSQIETVEVPIDDFNVTNSHAAPGSVFHVSFKLVALVAPDQKTAFDEAANTQHRARVRQAVLKIARSASLEDLNEPDLGTIKRLIREEINKVLRKSYVIEVVISEFKQMEQ